jgi:hypothetical protein
MDNFHLAYLLLVLINMGIISYIVYTYDKKEGYESGINTFRNSRSQQWSSYNK